jgi:hypothetical protein
MHLAHPLFLFYLSLSLLQTQFLSVAFSAAEKLGIPRLLDPEDMLCEPYPEVITISRFQICSQFTEDLFFACSY